MNNLFIGIAEACSIEYSQDRSIDWWALIFKSDGCTTYGPSPFVIYLIITIISGFILFFLFKKLKNGIQKKYLKVVVQISVTFLTLLFLWSIIGGIVYFTNIIFFSN